MAKRSKVGKFFTPKTVISGIVILIAIAAAIGANVIVRILPLLDNAAHYCSDKQI